MGAASCRDLFIAGEKSRLEAGPTKNMPNPD
jgi:hypothetical protein